LSEGILIEHRLFHSHDEVQYGEKAAVDGGDTKLGADLVRLLSLLIPEKFPDPSCALLLKYQVLVENCLDGGNRCPMGSS
jgi:hypothetical protein